MKKMISRLVLVSFLLLAMVSVQGALAGGCGPTGCNISAVASKAPATTSASHAFTASGGSRVADINLSQEARDGIIAEGKEAPLPKGCVTAADRAKLVAKQPPLYGWPQDDIPRSSSRVQSSYSIATHVSRNSPGKVQRSLAGPVKPVTAVKVAIAAKAKSQN